MKKILSLIIFALLLVGMLCMSVACGGDEGGSEPQQSQSETESETEIESEPDGDGTLTLILKKENGDVMEDIELVVYRDGEIVATLFTDSEGVAQAALPEGDYFVDYTGLPEYHLALTNFVEMTAQDKTVEVEILDNSPDGSKEKPFFVGAEPTECVIPAGKECYFKLNAVVELTVTVKGGSSVTVYSVDEEGNEIPTSYQPNAQGEIVFDVYTGDANTPALFAIENTDTADKSATVTVAMPLGSMENPYVIESLDELLIVSVGDDEMVYHSWTASESGVFVLESLSAEAEILISIITEAGDETLITMHDAVQGEKVLMITLKAEDEIIIAVSSTSGSADIVLSLSFSRE